MTLTVRHHEYTFLTSSVVDLFPSLSHCSDYIYFALVNCSAGSSEEICSRFSIQETYGFPAVMAWRSLHTGSADEAECETQPTDASQTSEASWLHVDYHSAISVSAPPEIKPYSVALQVLFTAPTQGPSGLMYFLTRVIHVHM